MAGYYEAAFEHALTPISERKGIGIMPLLGMLMSKAIQPATQPGQRVHGHGAGGGRAGAGEPSPCLLLEL